MDADEIFAEWDTLVLNRSEPAQPVELRMPGQPGSGTSGIFSGQVDDPADSVWWITPTNNAYGVAGVVNEFVVGSAGALIGAPICPVRFVQIGEDFAGSFAPGRRYLLEAGLAIATQDIPSTSEDRRLRDINRDSNQARHAGIWALWDWCYGQDEQWLFQSNAEETVHSHDHGMYLGGIHRPAGYLRAIGDVAHVLSVPTAGFDPQEIARLISALESVDRAQLLDIVNAVPPSWTIDDSPLREIGALLECRAAATAQRLGGL